MKAFISYSHQDSEMLTLLHKHLTQLQRDSIISAWTDRDIKAGGKLDQNISSALDNSAIFIALLSPDYLASNYCYEKEFKKALEMQAQGMLIIPVIVEPCDWLNTPFKDFKALPTDGKPVSTWENKNNAFLDIIQNIRKLVSLPNGADIPLQITTPQNTVGRNYRVQKDFDSIQKIEFTEKTLHEIKDYLTRYIEEIVKLDNIKSRTLMNNNKEFESILVNRNKISTESQLKVSIVEENSSSMFYRSNEKQITYSFNGNKMRDLGKTFTLSNDDYHMFWLSNDYSRSSQMAKELSSKEITELIWNEWLESVGIL